MIKEQLQTAIAQKEFAGGLNLSDTSEVDATERSRLMMIIQDKDREIAKPKSEVESMRAE